MYGRYGYSFHYSDDLITLDIKKEGEIYRYTRTQGDETVEKTIISEKGKIIINPVEPLNLPTVVSHHLEIEFEPIFIEPDGNKSIYLTFPIEIGIFLVAKKDIEVLDIFSFESQKYSLYGSSSEGIITRWARSSITSEAPQIDPLKNGVLHLTILNQAHEWIKVSHVVLDGYAMKIYYDNTAAMEATMELLSPHTAETRFSTSSPDKGMKKSIEIYSTRNIPIVKRTYSMEWGLV